MKITIDLPEQVVTDTAIAAWKAAFVAPDYHNARREGHAAVNKAVTDYLAEPEVLDAIHAAVRASYQAQHVGIVRDVVAEELRKLVKKVVKEQKDEGKLI